MKAYATSERGSRCFLASGIATLALIAGGAASAQSTASTATQGAADDRAMAMNEIVVTASRRPELLSNVGMGLTAITGDALEARNIRTFEDLMPLVPGLSIQSSSPVVTRLILRGLNAGGAGSTVATYIDDTPVGSSNALLQGAILTANADTFDMERIEVLKGPQGTLYGANSQGGLIKYVTRAPDTSGFSGRVQGEVNSVEHGEIGYAARGVVNVPLGEGAAVRVGGFYEKLPGFIDDTNLGINNVNDGKRYGGRVSALVQLGEAANLRLVAFHQVLKSNANPAVDVIGSPATYGQPGIDIFNPFQGDLEQRRYIETFRSNRFTNVAGTFDWDFGEVVLTAITSYGRSVNRDLGDAGNLSAFYVPPATPEAPLGVPVGNNEYFSSILGAPVFGQVQQYFRLNKITQELRLGSGENDHFDWQIGGFFTRESTFSNQSPRVVFTETGDILPIGDFIIDARYREFAGFGDFTYKFSDQFELNFGGRYSTNKQRAVTSAGGFTLTLQTKEDAFTFSVSPKFKLNDGSLLYGRFASGFRPGGPNLVPPGAPADYPRSYDSDKTRNYEVGFRSVGANRKLTVDIAAFWIDWTDIQILTEALVSGQQIFVTGNGGKARSRGVEFALGVRPAEGLNFSLTGAYTDAELTEDAPGLGGQSGDRLAYVPEFSTTLDGEYRRSLNDGAEGYLGFTLAYIGKRFTDFGTSPQFTPHIELPDYVTLGLRAGAEIGNIRIEAYARNVTDERGVLGYSNAGGGAPTITGIKTIIQPRTFGLLATTRF